MNPATGDPLTKSLYRREVFGLIKSPRLAADTDMIAA
jgi:hypothetical protein